MFDKSTEIEQLIDWLAEAQVRHQPDQRLQEAQARSLVFLFALGASSFAKTRGAAPCPSPMQQNMSLIAGEPISWQLLA